ncbi:MAG: hypothetical protein NT130_04475 [Candidatus Micrarchaeota archaeon]|nr:hypothetical protein [Candidatus Micrarchaeota archaeon]
MSKDLICLLVLVAMCSIAFSEATLQVTNYSIMPSLVYPGTFGYIQITLKNTGDAKAQSPTAYYELAGVASSLAIGDINAGGSTQISIPFRIPQGSGGTIQIDRINIYYSYSAQSGTSQVEVTSVSVPMQVSQEGVLQVRTLSLDKTSIAPGEKLSLNLELINGGGVVNDLVVTTEDNSSFSIYGATQQVIGSIPSNSSVNVSIDLLSSSLTTSGTYNVPLVFTYQDAINNRVEDTLYIGPVSVLEESSQYRLYLEPLTPVEIGSKAVFNLTLKNMGSNMISALVDMNSTEVFTPIGIQKIYFDSIAPGSSRSTNITLGVASSKSAGYYTFQLTLTPSAGKSITYDAGVIVDATPELTLSLKTQSSGSMELQIANTGNTAVRSVYVRMKPHGSSTGATESFLGTLNVDDIETVDLSSSISGTIDVEITFRDSNNIRQTITRELGTTSNFNSTVEGTQGGLNNSRSFGSGRPQGGIAGLTTGSIDWGQIALTIGTLVLLIVGAWFAYKRFGKKKRQEK